MTSSTERKLSISNSIDSKLDNFFKRNIFKNLFFKRQICKKEASLDQLLLINTIYLKMLTHVAKNKIFETLKNWLLGIN